VTSDPGVPVPPARVPVERPLVTRWWFWTIVGGVAAATVGVALYATRDDGATLLPPVMCDATGCR